MVNNMIAIKKRKYWAVFDRKRLALMDGRLPIFWHKEVAELWAQDHGLDKSTVQEIYIKN